MRSVLIRAGALGDAVGINEVYNPFIRASAATFETEEYDTPGRQAWLKARAANSRLPVVVAEGANGRLLGFASASPFDPRGGYQTSTKLSVFVCPDAYGAGLGRQLYEALFRALASTDLHRAYALIVPPNPASVALHEAFGFAHISTLNEVGRKFGRFYDVMWFEKHL